MKSMRAKNTGHIISLIALSPVNIDPSLFADLEGADTDNSNRIQFLEMSVSRREHGTWPKPGLELYSFATVWSRVDPLVVAIFIDHQPSGELLVPKYSKLPSC